jgi:hypothetical protein
MKKVECRRKKMGKEKRMGGMNRKRGSQNCDMMNFAELKNLDRGRKRVKTRKERDVLATKSKGIG